MRKIGANGGFGLGKDRHIITHSERNSVSVHSKGLVDFVNLIKVDCGVFVGSGVRGDKNMEAWWRSDPKFGAAGGLVLVIDDGKVKSTRRLIDGGQAIEMEMECLKDGTTATMIFSRETV